MQIPALALKLLPSPSRYSAASSNSSPEEEPARPLLTLPPSHSTPTSTWEGLARWEAGVLRSTPEPKATAHRLALEMARSHLEEERLSPDPMVDALSLVHWEAGVQALEPKATAHRLALEMAR